VEEDVMTNISVRPWANRTLSLVFIVAAGFVASDTLNTAHAQGGYRGRGRANVLTGTYQLNPRLSDNPATVADRVTRTLTTDRQRLRDNILRRLDAPDMMAIERRGRSISLASSAGDVVTFDADGREQVEQTRNGRTIRTVATLNGDRLDINTNGDRTIDYQVSFEPLAGGRSLRVTRRVTDERLTQPVVSRSVYDRVSDDARLGMYSENRPAPRPADVAPARPRDPRNDRADVRGDFGVPGGTEIVATLNDNVSTRQSRPEDPFSLTVLSPPQFEGATIDGRVAGVDRTGRVAGRADIAFDFERIRLRNGRTFDFDGTLESIRTTGGDNLRVEHDGAVQDEGSQTGRTATRTGVGAAIGAVIGAIAGGGKGAAIGAAVGAGAGAGSVLIEGRDELELLRGTEFRIRANDFR
jgi:hypothetical protein